MNKQLRQAVIAGNWKMNKTRPEAKALIEELKPIAANATCGVVICVPYTNLETAIELTKGTNIKVVQKMYTLKRAVHLQAKFQPICSQKWALNMLS